MSGKSVSRKESLNPAGTRPEQPPSRHHSVQFYSDDRFLLECVGRFIGSGLSTGEAAVVVATESHRVQLAEMLAAKGLNVAHAVEQGRYLALDAAKTLSQFMRGGRPDQALFADCVGGLIDRANAAAGKENACASVFGEMVALLWKQGDRDAAIELEQFWNRLGASHSFSLLCAYPLRDFQGAADAEGFRAICEQHDAVQPAESYADASDDDRRRLLSMWQQKAEVLQADFNRQAETQIAAAKLAAIVESSEDAIASKDLNGVVTSWNAAAERMFGYKAHEIIGKPITLIIPPELQSDEDMILDRIRHGIRIQHFETVRVRKNGERIHVSLTVSPVKDHTGKIIGAAKIARDITVQKRTEEALRRAEKLAATGRMAATIAHEINNPLEAVTNLLYLLRFEVDSERGRQHLALAESELARVSQITKQTLAFYHDSARPETVDVREILESVTSMFAHKIERKRLTLARNYEACVIQGMKGELRQLFSNVIDNAIEASPWGGELRIAITCHDGQAAVSVGDDGPGIPAENLSRLFEPFFTTKQVGTGLGLWVARGIAEKHGGTIAAESGVGSGATFRVTLKSATESKPARSAA